MRYNDATGHWELWDGEKWRDLFTCDTNRALAQVRAFMEQSA